MTYSNELNKLLNAIQKIEPEIKITKRERWFRYCYVNNINNIINYDNKCYEIFDLKSAIIKFLKINTGKEFTTSQIAVWIVETYSQEAARKVQTSNDKLLMNVNKMSNTKEILLYKNEMKTLLPTTIPKIEPNIKIIKKGNRAKYCYINNTDKIFDISKIIKVLENYKKQKLTAMEMTQLLLSANAK
ncbi:hypothetical protein ACE5D9_04940 [Rickettsia sp. 2024-CO-Wats]|uniref:hypothetical protein n=1 Tax=unclassified Rickettsia TaxID=114295 RepID=UPI00370D85C2